MTFRLRSIMAGVMLAGAFMGSVGCAPKPIDLQFNPNMGETKPKQYYSSVRIAFVPFEDARMIPVSTGNKKLIGWGANTYDTSVDVVDHVTQAFVDQYRYLGFKVTRVKSIPPNFSFTSNAWVRNLHSDYPDVDIFVIGKLHDFEFLLNLSGFEGLSGQQHIRTAIALQLYFVDAQNGKIIWGDMIRHNTQNKRLSKKEPTLYASIRLDENLQNVIFQSVDRSIPHINKFYPGAVRSLNSNMAEPLKTPGGSEAGSIPSGKGRLEVRTKPSGANVYVDGVYYGVSPLALDVEPGIHLLKVKKEGFETRREKIGVLSGSSTPWSGILPKGN